MWRNAGGLEFGQREHAVQPTLNHVLGPSPLARYTRYIGVDLGVTAADIQAKLTIAGIGVVSPYRDSYSWAGEIYGFTYSVNANDNKSVYVDHLQGSSNYNFKYYCVNQLGYPSAGQLLNFTTLQSLYGLTKVTLTYSSTLTIY